VSLGALPIIKSPLTLLTVTAVYDEFKKDFFPGESVTVYFEDGDSFEGLIREKAKFPMIRQVWSQCDSTHLTDL
jgi:hypothetical protein